MPDATAILIWNTVSRRLQYGLLPAEATVWFASFVESLNSQARSVLGSVIKLRMMLSLSHDTSIQTLETFTKSPGFLDASQLGRIL